MQGFGPKEILKGFYSSRKNLCQYLLQNKEISLKNMANIVCNTYSNSLSFPSAKEARDLQTHLSRGPYN